MVMGPWGSSQISTDHGITECGNYHETEQITSHFVNEKYSGYLVSQQDFMSPTAPA